MSKNKTAGRLFLKDCSSQIAQEDIYKVGWNGVSCFLFPIYKGLVSTKRIRTLSVCQCSQESGDMGSSFLSSPI